MKRKIHKKCGQRIAGDVSGLSLAKRILLAKTIKEVRELLKIGKGYNASDKTKSRWKKNSELRMAEIRGRRSS